MTTRRGFITGAAALICAPALVRAQSLDYVPRARGVWRHYGGGRYVLRPGLHHDVTVPVGALHASMGHCTITGSFRYQGNKLNLTMVDCKYVSAPNGLVLMPADEPPASSIRAGYWNGAPTDQGWSVRHIDGPQP